MPLWRWVSHEEDLLSKEVEATYFPIGDSNDPTWNLRPNRDLREELNHLARRSTFQVQAYASCSRDLKDFLNDHARAKSQEVNNRQGLDMNLEFKTMKEKFEVKMEKFKKKYEAKSFLNDSNGE